MTPSNVHDYLKFKGIDITKEDAEKVSAGIARFESNNLEDGWNYEIVVQILNEPKRQYTVIPSTILNYTM